MVQSKSPISFSYPASYRPPKRSSVSLKFVQSFGVMKPKPTLQPDTVPSDVLTPSELYDLLHISRVSLWRLVHDGRIPALRLSRRLKRFLRSDVLALKGDN